MSKIFIIGAQDYCRNVLLSDNPFFTTEERDEWERGWRAAEKEDKNQKLVERRLAIMAALDDEDAK